MKNDDLPLGNGDFFQFATAFLVLFNGLGRWVLGRSGNPMVFVPSNIEVFCRCPLKGKSMEIPGPKNGWFFSLGESSMNKHIGGKFG
jgi:hypothetical protein